MSSAKGKGKRKRVDSDYSDPYSYASASSSASKAYYASQTTASSASATSRLLNMLDGMPGEQTPQYAPQTPPAKRARKKKDPDVPEPEKRGAIFKKACPKNILERVDRVISQRFFMIDRRREGSELREEFSVLGSTGNVYTVSIDRKPSCNCPDASKGNHCKHILFIFLKVLQVSQNSTHWYQKGLLTSELAEIFRDAPPAPGSVATTRIREAYAKATGKAPTTTSSQEDASAGGKKRRIPVEGDDCPVCYEGMHGSPQSKLAFCEECGNALHKECFQQWACSKPNPTCVFCRAKWVTPGASGAGRSASTSEGYVNLSGVAGVSPVRDTGTYYQGPRRGQRYYGYQDYGDDFAY